MNETAECPADTDDEPENITLHRDLPPEYCQYRDEGCTLYPSCLDCPFPGCVFEERGGMQRRVKTERNETIVRQYYEDKRSVAEIAGRFGVSTRTIHRALCMSRKPGVDSGSDTRLPKMAIYEQRRGDENR